MSSFFTFFVLECHGLLSCAVTAVCAAGRQKTCSDNEKEKKNCCVSPPLAPQITLLSTNMMLWLPLASHCFLLCLEWHCSLRSLLLWFMNRDMFHQREWVPGGGEKGFDLSVLLKYDCKIRIKWQSLWGREISVCPAQCLACFGCHVINNRGWVMGDALKSCLLILRSWGAVLSSCYY